MRRFASVATWRRRSSGLPPSPWSSNASTAMREATSPARAPPMPSATANTGSRSRYESSLLCRWRPTSVRLACSAIRRATPSLLVAVLGLAYPDRVGRLQLLRPRELALVEVSPVGRSEVLDVHGVSAGEDAGVGGGRERILDSDVRRRGPPECRLLMDFQDRARLEPHRGHDLEPRRASGSHRGRRSSTAARSPARLLGRDSAAARDVAGRAPRDPQEEQVQHDQEAELQRNGDGIRVHRYSSSNRSRASPSSISSPGARTASSTRRPFTLMPFVEPRSVTTQWPSWLRTSAWRREAFGSSRVMSQSRLRPISTRLPERTARLPSPTSSARPEGGGGVSGRAARSAE